MPANLESERKILELVKMGVFDVDDQGRVWRLKEYRGGQFVKCLMRRAEKGLEKADYLQVRQTMEGKTYQASANRLVWMVKRGDIPAGMEINHKNGIKFDNRPENLEPMTKVQNLKHAHRTGLKNQTGQRNPVATLTDAQVAQIRHLYFVNGYKQAELAKRFGVTHQHISRLLRGDRRGGQAGPTTSKDLRTKEARKRA